MSKLGLQGGDRLKAKLVEIAKLVSRPGTLEVGFLSGATYPNGTPVAYIASIQEFGAPKAGIPPRPFFRPMIADKSPRWGEQLGRILVAQGYDAPKALALMGAGIKGQLQESIVAVTDPPLAPRTVARKGSSKPLVETGNLLASVDFQVTTES